MSFLGFSRHIAVFLDSNGEQLGRKIFKYSFNSSLGLSKKTFEYNGGTYNIDPLKSSRLNLSFKTAFVFNNYIYLYKENNPNPISFKGDFKPIMNADLYKIRLKSKLVEELNKVAWGSVKINWKLILIFVFVAIGLYFLLKDPSILTKSAEVVNNTSVIENITAGRG